MRFDFFIWDFRDYFMRKYLLKLLEGSSFKLEWMECGVCMTRTHWINNKNLEMWMRKFNYIKLSRNRCGEWVFNFNRIFFSSFMNFIASENRNFENRVVLVADIHCACSCFSTQSRIVKFIVDDVESSDFDAEKQSILQLPKKKSSRFEWKNRNYFFIL